MEWLCILENGKVSHLVAICIEYHGITRSVSYWPMNGFTMPTSSAQRAIDVIIYVSKVQSTKLEQWQDYVRELGLLYIDCVSGPKSSID